MENFTSMCEESGAPLRVRPQGEGVPSKSRDGCRIAPSAPDVSRSPAAWCWVLRNCHCPGIAWAAGFMGARCFKREKKRGKVRENNGKEGEAKGEKKHGKEGGKTKGGK